MSYTIGKGRGNMKGILKVMIEIYKPDGIDWMGFELSRHNPYTFHHIKEKCNRGKVNVNNGAILTKNAHRLLNILEKDYPIAYEHYQNLFKRINANKGPLTDDLKEDIYGMLLDLFYHQQYGDTTNLEVLKFGTPKGHVKDKKQHYINRR